MTKEYTSLDNKIIEVLKERAKENKDQDMVLITPALLQHYLGKKYGLNPSLPTIRKNGFGRGRDLDVEYDSTQYRHDGDPNKRGLIMKTEQFLKEV
jgi:hypothetical protein